MLERMFEQEVGEEHGCYQIIFFQSGCTGWYFQL